MNLSGPFVNNVTGVHYAGYNGNNNNCAVNIPTTVINGAPVTASTNILFAPPATLSNPFGYNSIICAYSCNVNSNQGGCNTADQIEAYFATVFPGSSLRFHRIQYNCWSGNQNMSNSGNCCANPTLPLTASITSTQPSCNTLCNGSVTATASGGQAPYVYHWISGPTNAVWTNRCAGTYTITVSDANNATDSSVVTLNNPLPVTQSVNTSACKEYFFNGQFITQSGVYIDTLISASGCDSILNLNLTIQQVDTAVTLNGITATANASNATYQWFNCTNQSIVNGANAQSFTAPWTGFWSVIITQNNCTDTSRCIRFGPNSVGEISMEKCYIYPNPNYGQFTIEIPGNKTGLNIELHDVLGRNVY